MVNMINLPMPVYGLQEKVVNTLQDIVKEDMLITIMPV